MNLEFDQKYFDGLAQHSNDYLSYGGTLVFVSSANLWAFVLHGMITDEIKADLKRRGYQVVWAREAMPSMRSCTVNEYYIGQKLVEFWYYAFV